jgi:hypothetical protein
VTEREWSSMTDEEARAALATAMAIWNLFAFIAGRAL